MCCRSTWEQTGLKKKILVIPVCSLGSLLSYMKSGSQTSHVWSQYYGLDLVLVGVILTVTLLQNEKKPYPMLEPELGDFQHKLIPDYFLWKFDFQLQCF